MTVMKTEPLKTWTGIVDECDICRDKIFQSFFDAKTKMGPWALMCPDCYLDHGIRLGEGFGQSYKLTQIGNAKFWVKQQG